MSERTEIFSNDEFGEIRTTMIDGVPWFVGKDVTAALGYRNTKDALKSHVDVEDKIMGARNATPSITDSMGRTQKPTWINESGLYALIFGSKLPSAKRFKRWVTSEVLPTLRKTGTYSMPQAQEQLPAPVAEKQVPSWLTDGDEERQAINRGIVLGIYRTEMAYSGETVSDIYARLSARGKKAAMELIFGEGC